MIFKASFKKYQNSIFIFYVIESLKNYKYNKKMFQNYFNILIMTNQIQLNLHKQFIISIIILRSNT